MTDRFPFAPEERTHLLGALARFPHCRILVVGDVMLDTFIWGEVSRISPEAPVPVVEVREETQLLGGTANVVHNVARLGARVQVAGVIGCDFPAQQLVKLFNDLAVPTSGLICDAARPTTMKTRIIAQNQQVVRFDREQRTPLSPETVSRVLGFIEAALPQTDGLIISDYAKGVVTPEFMDAIRSMTAGSPLPVIVDPKVQHTELYRRVTLVTPNHLEASRMSGIDIHDEESLLAAGKCLLERLECRTVLITRGKHGMSLFPADGPPVHIPTVARRVYDVTGAGDTVIAAITLGIVAGLSSVEAAMLANLAAGIVVGEVGTAAVSADQLRAVIENGAC